MDMMEHLTQEKALNYICGTIADDELYETDRHLAACDQCAGRVRTLRRLRADFETAWDSWTARSHVRTDLNVRIAGALSRAADSAASAGLRTRIDSWRKKIRFKAEAALKVIVNRTEVSANIIYQGLEDLFRPDSMFKFSPVGSMVKGIAETLPARVSIRADGTPWAQVNVDAQAGNITVQLGGPAEPLPLILLLPSSGAREPMVGELRKEEGYFSTEFKNVPGGEYILLIEALD